MSQDYRFDEVCWNTNDSHLVFHLLRNTRPCLYWVITLICHFLYGPRLCGTLCPDIGRILPSFLRSAKDGNFSRIGDRVRLLQRYGGKPAQRRTHPSLRNNLKSWSTRDKWMNPRKFARSVYRGSLRIYQCSVSSNVLISYLWWNLFAVLYRRTSSICGFYSLRSWDKWRDLAKK